MKNVDPFVVVMVGLMLIVTFTGAYIAGANHGKEIGAKIALALEAPDDYRGAEVRGSCEKLFDGNECIECHDFEQYKKRANSEQGELARHLQARERAESWHGIR